MTSKRSFILLALGSLFMPFLALANDKIWKLATTEWPPGLSKKLPGGGMYIALLKDIMKTQGIDLLVEEYPWTRALEVAKGKDYLGAYSAYYDEVPAEGFEKSVDIFFTSLGLAERVSSPLDWNTLKDLKGKNFGVSQGAGTTDEFTELVKQNTIKKTEVSGADADTKNLQMLANGRVDAAVIDTECFSYIVGTQLKNLKNKIQMNKKILSKKPNVIAVNKNFFRKDAQEVIKKAMIIMTPQKVEKFIHDYMNTHFNAGYK